MLLLAVHTNRFGSGVVFNKIPCDKETQKLWLIALKPAKPPNDLKHACVRCDRFLEGDYCPSYKMQSEVIGRSAEEILKRICRTIRTKCVFLQLKGIKRNRS